MCIADYADDVTHLKTEIVTRSEHVTYAYLTLTKMYSRITNLNARSYTCHYVHTSSEINRVMGHKNELPCTRLNSDGTGTPYSIGTGDSNSNWFLLLALTISLC